MIYECYQYQRSPSQENQLRIDRCDSKGSKRPKGCPRPSFSYSTDAYCSWHCEKDEAQEGQRWMGRHTGSSALLEHYRLSGSRFTLRPNSRTNDIEISFQFLLFSSQTLLYFSTCLVLCPVVQKVAFRSARFVPASSSLIQFRLSWKMLV